MAEMKKLLFNRKWFSLPYKFQIKMKQKECLLELR